MSDWTELTEGPLLPADPDVRCRALNVASGVACSLRLASSNGNFHPSRPLAAASLLNLHAICACTSLGPGARWQFGMCRSLQDAIVAGLLVAVVTVDDLKHREMQLHRRPARQ